MYWSLYFRKMLFYLDMEGLDAICAVLTELIINFRKWEIYAEAIKL